MKSCCLSFMTLLFHPICNTVLFTLLCLSSRRGNRYLNHNKRKYTPLCIYKFCFPWIKFLQQDMHCLFIYFFSVTIPLLWGFLFLVLWTQGMVMVRGEWKAERNQRITKATRRRKEKIYICICIKAERKLKSYGRVEGNGSKGNCWHFVLLRTAANVAHNYLPFFITIPVHLRELFVLSKLESYQFLQAVPEDTLLYESTRSVCLSALFRRLLRLQFIHNKQRPFTVHYFLPHTWIF